MMLPDPAVATIERRCVQAARRLEARGQDEVTLLRTARALKRVHADLRRALFLQACEDGWTDEVRAAEARLGVIERDLRCVLLGHSRLPVPQVQRRLAEALDQSFEMLNALA